MGCSVNDNNVFFSVPFLLQNKRPITWNKIRKRKKKPWKSEKYLLHFCDRPLVLSLSLYPSTPSPPPTPHTRIQSVGLLKKVGFKWWFEGWEGVGWFSFVRKSVPDCQCSIRKWPLIKQMCACRGNTENGSIRKWAKLAGWMTNSFSWWMTGMPDSLFCRLSVHMLDHPINE